MGNVSKFMDNLTGRRRVIFLVLIIVICIIAIGIAIYASFFYQYADTDPLMLGLVEVTSEQDEKYAELKADFPNIFTNEIYMENDDLRVEKIETQRSLVFANYSYVDIDEAYHDVDAQIPMINIESDVAEKINAEIKDEFYETANITMRQKSQFIIYKVSFVAYVNDNYLSIAIKENSKYGDDPEATRIKTYVYDLDTNKEVSLSDLIKYKGTNEQDVQKSIDSVIQSAYDNSLGIANEYGTGFVRDIEDSRYEIKNTESFFLTDDGYVYIIYSYGDEAKTNEMDIVIFN